MELRAFYLKCEGDSFVLLGYGEEELPPLRFMPAHIDRLDREGRAKRSAPHGVPDFRSYAELLRAVGDSVKAKESRLLEISKDEDALIYAIHHETEQGRRIEEKYLSSDAYDLCIRMYKQRTTAA